MSALSPATSLTSRATDVGDTTASEPLVPASSLAARPAPATWMRVEQHMLLRTHQPQADDAVAALAAFGMEHPLDGRLSAQIPSIAIGDLTYMRALVDWLPELMARGWVAIRGTRWSWYEHSLRTHRLGYPWLTESGVAQVAPVLGAAGQLGVSRRERRTVDIDCVLDALRCDAAADPVWNETGQRLERRDAKPAVVSRARMRPDSVGRIGR